MRPDDRRAALGQRQDHADARSSARLSAARGRGRRTQVRPGLHRSGLSRRGFWRRGRQSRQLGDGPRIASCARRAGLSGSRRWRCAKPRWACSTACPRRADAAAPRPTSRRRSACRRSWSWMSPVRRSRRRPSSKAARPTMSACGSPASSSTASAAKGIGGSSPRRSKRSGSRSSARCRATTRSRCRSAIWVSCRRARRRRSMRASRRWPTSSRRMSIASASCALAGDLGFAEAPPAIALRPPGQRIALARDEAFSFVYPHLVRGWRLAGAEIAAFSPLADEPPPRRLRRVLAPGRLSRTACRAARRRASASSTACAVSRRRSRSTASAAATWRSGRASIDASGVAHAMAGLLGVETSFLKRRMTLGYREAKLAADCALGRGGRRFARPRIPLCDDRRRGGDAPFAFVTDAYGAPPRRRARAVVLSPARSSTPSPAGSRSARAARIFPAPVRQRRLFGAFTQADDGAENDRMRMSLDHFLDQAVERGERVREHGRAGGERDPAGARRSGARPCTPPRPLKRCASASCRAASRLTEKAPASCKPASVEDDRARQMKRVGGGERQGGERGDGAADALFLLAAGDDRDPGGQRPHRVAERRAVGVMKTALAHAPRLDQSLARAPVCGRRRGTVAARGPERASMILVSAVQ